MIRYTGDYGHSGTLCLDNLCHHEQMPPGMIIREHGGALPEQWLMAVLYDPVDLSTADGMQGVPARSLMLWPPGPPQRLGASASAWDHSWMFVRGSRVPAIVEASGCPVHRPLPLARTDATDRFFIDCHREVTRGDSDLMVIEHLLALWLRSSARDAVALAPSAQDDGIQAARAHMERHLDRELSLADLAEVAGCSSSHFSARYLERYGASPISSLIELRMRRAQHLLRSTDWTIAAIAHAVGFRDAFHFTRSFTRRVGRAPSRWRLDPGPRTTRP